MMVTIGTSVLSAGRGSGGVRPGVRRAPRGSLHAWLRLLTNRLRHTPGGISPSPTPVVNRTIPQLGTGRLWHTPWGMSQEGRMTTAARRVDTPTGILHPRAGPHPGDALGWPDDPHPTPRHDGPEEHRWSSSTRTRCPLSSTVCAAPRASSA